MNRDQFFEEFEVTVSRMHNLLLKKGADYTGGDEDQFANFRFVEQLGVASIEQGFATRLADKMARLGSFIKNGKLEVEDEKVTDTLLDMANYAILLNIYLRSKDEGSR